MLGSACVGGTAGSCGGAGHSPQLLSLEQFPIPQSRSRNEKLSYGERVSHQNLPTEASARCWLLVTL